MTEIIEPWVNAEKAAQECAAERGWRAALIFTAMFLNETPEWFISTCRQWLPHGREWRPL